MVFFHVVQKFLGYGQEDVFLFLGDCFYDEPAVFSKEEETVALSSDVGREPVRHLLVGLEDMLSVVLNLQGLAQTMEVDPELLSDLAEEAWGISIDPGFDFNLSEKSAIIVGCRWLELIVNRRASIRHFYFFRA